MKRFTKYARIKPTSPRINHYFFQFLIVLGVIFCFGRFECHADTNCRPTGDWKTSTPEEQGMRSELLVKMMERIKERNYPIDSISIFRNGYLVFDAYQIQFVWRYRGGATLRSVAHIIAKENKAIRLAGHTVYNIDELLDIFKTINLNP